jgi:hypothetical protein
VEKKAHCMLHRRLGLLAPSHVAYTSSGMPEYKVKSTIPIFIFQSHIIFLRLSTTVV